MKNTVDYIVSLASPKMISLVGIEQTRSKSMSTYPDLPYSRSEQYPHANI